MGTGKTAKSESSVWRPFRREAYRRAWRGCGRPFDASERHVTGLLMEFGRDLRRIHERVWKGYCDYDLIDIDRWFLGVMPQMLQEFRDNAEGVPPAFAGNPEKGEPEGLDAWKAELDRMIRLFREADDSRPRTGTSDGSGQVIRDMEYRRRCCDEALDLFRKWFHALWD